MTSDEKRHHLAKRLRELRGELRQEDAAAKIGIDRSALSGLENGHMGLGKVRALKIAAGYGIPYAELEPYVTERGANGLGPDLRSQLEEAVQKLDLVGTRLGALADHQEKQDGHLFALGQRQDELLAALERLLAQWQAAGGGQSPEPPA